MKTLLIRGLKKKLYPFQHEGTSFIERKKGRALIADEMGLGKTIQAIAYAQLHPEYRPMVVVCPASVKWNWKNEIKSWMSSKRKTKVLKGKTPRKKKADVFIINYDILHNWLEFLKDKKPQLIVLDECHYIKNKKTKRTAATLRLCKKVPHVIALSGTPIVNRPVEFFNTLKLLRPKLFRSFWKYVNRYCEARLTRFGWDFSGASNTKRLSRLLRRKVMIRRLKKDVLSQLPPKTRAVVPLDINNRKEYKLAVENFERWLLKYRKDKYESAMRAPSLSKIEYLKQLAVDGKLDQAIEWIRDFIESGKKLFVLTYHHKTLRKIQEEFPNISVSAEDVNKREQAIHAFQHKKKIKIFLCNLKAAIGFNLTKASNVAIIEFGWTPSDHDQAEDRTHRVGQKKKVTVYYLVGRNTIDEDIINLIDKKRRTIEKIIEGGVQKEASIVSDLIKIYKKKGGK